MKRTTLMAALTGAAVLLAGCSSTSGTAAPASSSSAGVTSSSAMSSSAMSSSMAPASQPASSEAPGSSAAASVTEPSSSAPASDAPSSEATMSSEDTASSAASTPSASKAPTTVGNTSGGLDVKSAAWFSTFCGGVAPFLDGAKSLTKLNSAKTTKPQQVVDVLDAMGGSLTKTAASLKQLPAPEFNGGEAFASKTVQAFAAVGPQLTSAARKIEANPSSGQSAMTALGGALTKAAGPLTELNSLKLTAATQTAILKLPACAAMQKAATS